MKLKTLLIFFCLMALSLAYTRKQRQAWKQFKKQHNKCYSNLLEEMDRMQIFLKHKDAVDKINRDFCKGKSTYTAQIYEWHDLTPQEFSQQKLGLR